jgi:hypothetical protein
VARVRAILAPVRRTLPGLTLAALVRCGPAEPSIEATAPGAPVVDALELARSSLAIQGSQAVGGGTGVYVGDGLVLTNWHVAVSSALFDLFAQTDHGLDLPRSEYLEEFAEGTPTAEPVAGAISADDFYCLTSSTATRAATLGRYDGDEAPPPGRDLCVPVVPVDASYALFPPLAARPPDARPLSPRLAWASIELDLAIARVSPDEVRSTAGALPRLAIDPRPELALRDPVWVIGFPQGPIARLPYLPRVELCWVEVPAVEPLRDPDRVQPSDLVVKSFGIDCGTVAPGSSGSMVVDAGSGALLGLVWTRGPDGLTWVTPASAWLERLEDAPDATENRPLAELLRGPGPR